MAEKRFVWLVDDCFDGYGRKLERGKTYDAETFGLTVVEEWVKTDAAKWAGKEKPAKPEE